MCSKAQNNHAEAIALRRETFAPRLIEVHKAFKFLTGVIESSSEDNNEKTAILQSLLEESTRDGREQPSLQKLEEDNKHSEVELEAAQKLADSLIELEQYVCSISLENPKDGTKYVMKGLEEPLLFVNSSSHGPKIAASTLALNYILTQFKSEKLWDKQQVVNGNSEQETLVAEEEEGDGSSTEEGAVALDNNNVEESSLKNMISSFFLSHKELASPKSPHPLRREHVYLQFSVSGKLLAPVVIKLYHNKAPKVTYNFKEC